VGRITTAGQITEFLIPTPNSAPAGITVGGDGNLWFTEQLGNKIGRITTTGVIAEFPLPFANRQPFWITRGPDGALWFTEVIGSIGRLAFAPAAIPTLSLSALAALGLALGACGIAILRGYRCV
jgi:virginiamycin B lyase